MHQNIAGLISKADLLTVCLQELAEKDMEVDILCITEHFMKQDLEYQLCIPNYCLAACFSRKESKRGGACILIKNGLQWRELPKISKISSVGVFECCAIELIDHNTVIVCIYRVPNANNFNECVDKIAILLRTLTKKCHKNVIIAGDFNIDVLKRNKHSIEFENLLLNFDFKLALNEPTRLESQTCIDNFAHNFNKPCKTTVLEFALSDHTAQLLKFPIKKICAVDRWRIIRRDYCRENLIKFRNHLSSLTFSELYGTNDPNAAYNYFIELFTLLYDLCFPYVGITVKIKKKLNWISRGIKICSKKKRQLLWQYRLKPSLSNKTRLKNYAKKYKKIIKLTQRAQNSYKVKTAENKSKTIWQIIKQNKLNLPKPFIDKIRLNNKTVTEPNHIADLFNNYFIDKIEPIKNAGSGVTQHILNKKDSMFMAPSTPHDVFKIIRTLRNTNSVGYDGISTRILKAVAYEISTPLSYIINLSITVGVFPEALKKSVVKPLFKKENRELMQNYRPISLISIISKIFEKYMHRQLNSYVEKNNIICNEQKGFREKKTINMAIYDFLQTVMTNMDHNIPVCAIFCDMTQAFDYVHHSILIKKLEAYGVRGNVLKLFESYLQKRKQITEVSRINLTTKREEIHISQEREVKYGVPQGSVLGPPLFTLYINDLPKSIEQPMSLFADDSVVTIPCKNRNQYEYDVNKSLISIIKWLNNNNLKMNLNKTKIMHFRQRPLTLINKLDIKYNNTNIDSVDTTKFLGLIIDTKLNWKAHIETITKKISSSAYALYTLAEITSVDALLTAYYGLVESVLRYGIIFWGNSTDKDTIFKAQKKCIRSMFKLETTQSCRPYFEKYKILTLPSIYIIENAMFVRSNPNLFPRMAEVFPRNRRDDTQICIPQARTTLMRKSVFCMAPIIYNKLPKSWKLLSDVQFKLTVKKFLAERAYYTINDFLCEKYFE